MTCKRTTNAKEDLAYVVNKFLKAEPLDPLAIRSSIHSHTQTVSPDKRHLQVCFIYKTINMFTLKLLKLQLKLLNLHQYISLLLVYFQNILNYIRGGSVYFDSRYSRTGGGSM